MPSTGTPASNTACGARGEAPSVRLAGPPDRMMPRGRHAAIRPGIGVERPDFAIDAGLAQTAGNELGDLAAEVQDQNALGGERCGGGGIRQGIGHDGSGLRVACRSGCIQPRQNTSEYHYQIVAMEKVIQATEANRQFSRVLREVADGDMFTVTSHGRPIARIVNPFAPSPHPLLRDLRG